MPMGKMGFDRSIVVFSPEGRMYQVEYARKAVENLSTTAVGVVYANGVVLAAAKQTAKLMVTTKNEKILKIDEHIGVAACGIISDARVLIDYARIRAQINRLTFNEPIETYVLVKDVADRKQRFTQLGGIRPYGVGFLIAGYDSKPSLFETDPSGTIKEWKARAIGRGYKEAQKFLEMNYRERMNREDALKLAIQALIKGNERLTIENTEIGIVEDGRFWLLEKSEIKDVLKRYA